MFLRRAALAALLPIRAALLGTLRICKVLLVALMCGVLPPLSIEDPPPKNSVVQVETDSR